MIMGPEMLTGYGAGGHRTSSRRVGSGRKILGTLGEKLVFPFARGMHVRTMKGGSVIGGGERRYITNLNNSGPGSPRQAIETDGDGPADIFTEIGGDCHVTSQLVWSKDLSYHGYTAPLPLRILLENGAEMSIDGGFMETVEKNIAISHLPVYADTSVDTPWETDRWSHVYWEYCDVGYTNGELHTAGAECNFGTWYRCIIGPQYNPTPSSGGVKGFLLSGSNAPSTVKNIAIIECFWMNVVDRVIALWKNGTYLYAVNQLMYQSGHGSGDRPWPSPDNGVLAYGAFNWGPDPVDAESLLVFIGNHTIDGPDTNDNVNDFDIESRGFAGGSVAQYYHETDNPTIDFRNIDIAVLSTVAALEARGLVLPLVDTPLASTALEAAFPTLVGSFPAGDGANSGLRQEMQQYAFDQMALGSDSGESVRSTTPTYASRASASVTLSAIRDNPNWNHQALGQDTGWREVDEDLQELRLAAQGFI